MSLKNLKYLGLIFISLLAYNAYSQDKTQTDSLKRAMTDGQAVEMADSSGVETADSSGVELIDNPGKIVIDSLKRKGIIL
ncbi:MAG TPA: hypothetical protein PLO24_05745, partial [Bacteroidales bacterium]|nr:hypothetical protein [Bacteroidales bacterium]